MVLHMVNSSSLSSNALQSCLRVATKNSAILLIEDGVYAATLAGGRSNPLAEVKPGLPIFALQEDLQARGLTELLRPNIETVDYRGFVGLTVRYQSVLSWL